MILFSVLLWCARIVSPFVVDVVTLGQVGCCVTVTHEGWVWKGVPPSLRARVRDFLSAYWEAVKMFVQDRMCSADESESLRDLCCQLLAPFCI